MLTSSEANLPIVVIDLDNTLIDYGMVFHARALGFGLITSETPSCKISIQKQIADDHDWLKLQHEVYTEGIRDAEIDRDAIAFAEDLKCSGYRPVIVSHKTSVSAWDLKTDLRQPAFGFLESRAVFSTFLKDDLYFEETFENKVNRIRDLKPALVIDDLAKVVNHPALSQLNRVHFGRANVQDKTAITVDRWSTMRALFHLIDRYAGKGWVVSPMRSTSNNVLVSVKSAQGRFVAKVFPDDARGLLSAEKEFTAAEILRTHDVETPRYIARERNVVFMEELSGPTAASSARAYRSLNSVLEKTKNINAVHYVNDDSGTMPAFLDQLILRKNSLRERQPEKLSVTLTEQVELAFKRLSTAEPFSHIPVPRFILSDFSPDNFAIVKDAEVFLDLEDAGLGDTRRFIANLILHPKSQIKDVEISTVLETLTLRQADLNEVFEFSYLEWVLIIAGHDAGRAERRMNFYSNCVSQDIDLFESFMKRREELR